MGSASSQLCAWVDVEEISHSTLNMLPMQIAPHSPVIKPAAPTADKLPSLSLSTSTHSEFSTSDSASSVGSAQSSHKARADPLAPVAMRRAISLEAVQMKDSSCAGDCTINRVSARIHTILLDHNSPAPSRSDLIAYSEFEPSVRQIFTLTRRGDLPSSSRNHLEQPVPSAQQIAAFIAELAKKSQLEKGCVVVALVYIDRLIHSARLRLTALNWRHVVFASILMASKVWDDVSMWSVDFASVSQFFTLQQANAMELLILKLLEWNVGVSPSEYSATFLSLFDSAADLAASGVSLSDITVTAEEMPPSPSSSPSPSPLSDTELSSSDLSESASSPLQFSPISRPMASSCADEIIHAAQPMPLSVAF